MKFSTLAGAVSAAALLATAPAAFADHHGGGHGQTVMVGGAAMYANKTIVENAVASPIHTTLVAAVTAAGLVETLSGPGPFTVFAPTDEAFAALPAGTVEDLVKPENKDKLTAILTLHVLSGAVHAADIAGKTLSPASVNGEDLNVDGTDGVTINGANVVTADIECTNGVIHVIDAVLLPKG